MSITESELKRRLRPWVKELIMAGGGGAGPFLSGSGTTGRIAEWGGATTLQSSTLIKSGAGVLTLSAGSTYTLTVAATSSIAGTLSGGGTVATGGYTLTVPGTGTAVLGSGTANRLAVWSDANNITTSYALTTVGDLVYMANQGSTETLTYFETTEVTGWTQEAETVRQTFTFSGAVGPTDSVQIDIDIWMGACSLPSTVVWRLRRNSVSGGIVASYTFGTDGSSCNPHYKHWVDSLVDSTPAGVYVLTTENNAAGFGTEHKSDYRYVVLQHLSADPIPARLPIGATSDILQVVSGVPAWRSLALAGIVPTTRTITEGAGLAGNTYDLSANRTLAMGTPSSVTSTSTNTASGTTHTHVADSTLARTADVIANSLLTTRGDIIRRGASAPERYALSVPGAGTLNYLGVNNGEVDPTWKSASANPGAAAAILQSNASGYLQLTGLGVGAAPTALIPATVLNAASIGADSSSTYRALSSILTLSGNFAYQSFNEAAIFGQARILVGKTSGLVSQMAGLNFSVANQGGTAGATIASNLYGVTVTTSSTGPGKVGGITGLYSECTINNVDTIVTNYFGARLQIVTKTAGTLTNQYGLYVDPVNQGGTLNYAIYTNAGLVRFGDQMSVTGSADRIQALIKNNATQTTNPLEVQTSAGAQLAYITPTGGAVINESGDAAGDFRVESDTEANFIFLDANGNTDGTLYLGGSTNGIQILKGGEMTLIGTATRWDDLRIEPVVRGTGSKNPSFNVWLGGLYLYDFDDALVAKEKEVWFQVQMPHPWKEGSTVYPHVHWVNRTAGTAGHVVRWGLEYTKAVIGGTFGATTTIYGTTINGGGDITVANEHLLTSFAGVDMTGDTLSTVIVCRLFRNSSNAADTYTGTAGLLYIDWHYEIDSMGSSQEFVK